MFTYGLVDKKQAAISIIDEVDYVNFCDLLTAILNFAF